MNDWTAGYVTDLEYTAGFYRDMSPPHLRLCSLLFGVTTTPSEEGFAYCELGCGKGMTSLILAAANPEGRFVAVDFNPSHILNGRALARASGLANIEFIECGFEELVNGRGAGLPEFDFITLHGVYSWVGPDVRAAIVRFIAKFLKPGGLVYVSYNAMPGWATGLPVQRLLLDVAALGWERSDGKMTRAAAVIEKLKNAGAKCFTNNYFVEEVLRLVRLERQRYLVHEYLNEQWQPLYYADVARDLRDAKLTYLGSADLFHNFPAFQLSKAQWEIVDEFKHEEVRETIKDFLAGRKFRSDIYVRGRKPMLRLRHQELLGQVKLALTVPRAQFKMKLAVPAGDAEMSQATYEPIADALAERPHSVHELLDLVKSRSNREVAAGEIIATLVGSEQALPFTDGAALDGQEIADRFNAALLARIDEFEPNSRVGLAVTSLGTGIYCTFLEALLYRSLLSRAGDVVDHTAREALRLIAARGDKVLKDGEPIEDEASALGVLRSKVREITESSAVVWQKFLPRLQAPG
jgi:SAM-dependent methyltransferase